MNTALLSRRRVAFVGISFFCVTPFAYALGSDLLVSFGLHTAAVLGCLAYLQFAMSTRPRRFAMRACFSAVVLSEVAVRKMPYAANKVSITAVLVLAPIAATVLALVGRKLWLRWKR